MTGKDEYYNRAKQEDYRARSAYKLKQLDDEYDLLADGATVVDLGAAPGGWLQVAAERVGDEGRVIGADRQRIDAIDGVETVKGDITDDETKDAIREAAGGDVDVVLSDMAPNMTGEYNVDHARSVHLARQAFAVAQDLLAGGGHFVVKVFEGRDLEAFVEDVKGEFDKAWPTRPEATRDSSSEMYVVATGRLTAPVREGDVLEVDVEDVGSEGDGIAKVDGFTLFVPGAEAGETVEVRVTDVKPRFGFAERVE